MKTALSVTWIIAFASSQMCHRRLGRFVKQSRHFFSERVKKYEVSQQKITIDFSVLNPLKRSGVMWLHFDVFSAIQV